MKVKSQELLELERKADALREKLFPLQEELHTVCNLKRDLQEKEDEEYYKGLTSDTPKEGVDWEELLSESGYDSQAKYKARDRVFQGFCSSYGGLQTSGYFPETEQVAVRVSMTHGDEQQLREVNKALSFLLPYLKPQKDGAVHLGVFESTLSAHGVYTLKVKGDKVVLSKRTYGTEWDLKTFVELEDALEYVQKHHYYQGPSTDDEEE